MVGAFDFRVGAPWGKTALVTGWGENDLRFAPVKYENYFTASYVGIDRKFGERLDVRVVANDLRAWRVASESDGTTHSAIAQNLRPAGTVDFQPNHRWDFQVTSAYSSTRSFHVYDQIQNGFTATYARPFHRKFNAETGEVVLQYPIRFSGGLQQESFFNFSGPHSQQFRPYVRISLF
jgi:hypothetical protein